jgi:hypothetical protein
MLKLTAARLIGSVRRQDLRGGRRQLSFIVSPLVTKSKCRQVCSKDSQDVEQAM